MAVDVQKTVSVLQRRTERGCPMTRRIAFTTLMFAMTLECLALSFSPAYGHLGRKEGRGYFMVGKSFLDMDELNTRLKENGYATFSDSPVSLGAGGHGIVRDRFVIGGEGHALLSRTEESTIGGVDYGSRLSAGYGFFDVGVLAMRAGGLDVYPMLGLGGGGVSLDIRQSRIGSFEDLLEDPDRSATLSTWSFLINLGLGIDYLAVLGEGRNGEGGIVIGLRSGYIFSPFNGDWDFKGETLPGGPEPGLNGAYIRLTIGGGGRAYD
jgi:hypothetical protein